MSVLNGFLSTWSNARQTFGEGTPQTGSQYDASGTLNQLQERVQAAAPGSKWTGGAANAYGAANTDHARVFGQLAGLDQRLGAHVDQSAEVVAAGRRDLDAVRKWVVDAAASVPPGQAGEQMRLAIVQKGIAAVQDIIHRSNGEMNTIAGNMRGLEAEFRALSNQKFAKEGPNLVGPEGKKEDEEAKRRQAEKDVHDALAGDQEAAKRVEDALKGIKPGQPLSAEQGSYLSQMQAQQHGMSVDALKTAEQRLGDQKHIIGDSWQLMSNDKVWFPRTDTDVGALDDPNYRVRGGLDQLPQSVQDAVRNPGELNRVDDTNVLKHGGDLQSISEIVHDGNPSLQTNTELDRELMKAADTVMDSDVPQPYAANVTEDIFRAVAEDHQVVHDQIVGPSSDDFLHDVNHMPWTDDGKAAASLFSWTNEAHTGSEMGIASETAEKYAQYIGIHKGDLMNLPGIPGETTLGQLNPELVKGYAHGLSPYMADIASVPGGANDNFDFLDPGKSERPIAKGLFAVLGTQHDAYVEFNSAADKLGLERAHQYAEDVKHGVDVHKNDARILDAAVLRGLMASGSAEAAHSIGLNRAEVEEWRKTAYSTAVDSLAWAAGPAGPAITAFGSAMEDSIVGKAADPSTPIVPDMTGDESARFVLNALIADGVRVDGIDPNYMVDGRIASLEELQAAGRNVPADTDLEGDLNAVLDSIVGEASNPTDEFEDKYEQITKIPGAK